MEFYLSLFKFIVRDPIPRLIMLASVIGSFFLSLHVAFSEQPSIFLRPDSGIPKLAAIAFLPWMVIWALAIFLTRRIEASKVNQYTSQTSIESLYRLISLTSNVFGQRNLENAYRAIGARANELAFAHSQTPKRVVGGVHRLIATSMDAAMVRELLSVLPQIGNKDSLDAIVLCLSAFKSQSRLEEIEETANLSWDALKKRLSGEVTIISLR